MLKLALTTVALSSLLLAGAAGAAGGAGSPPRAAAPVQSTKAQRADPGKLRDCEAAWERQRIKKGSKKAFIRACVRHG